MVTMQATYVRKVGASDGIARLRSALHGELILPGDLQYDTTRRLFNASIDRHPALIVRCVDANDMQRIVEFGRASHLDIAVRGAVTAFRVTRCPKVD